MSRADSARQRLRSHVPDPRIVALGVGVVLFAALLLWLSDYLTRIAAQSLITSTVQQELGAQHRPSVHLDGTFFLPQVVHGVYDHVEIDVRSVQSGPLRIADIHADLHGVHLPLHDVLVRDTARILIDHTEELATLRYQDLDHYFAATDTPLSITTAGHGQVRLTGTVTVLGQQISASADAKITASGNTLEITPTQFASGIASVDNATRLLLGQRFTIEVPLQALPFGQTITRIHPTASGVAVRARGTDVLIK